MCMFTFSTNLYLVYVSIKQLQHTAVGGSPVSKEAKSEAAEQEAHIESGLVHVHQPSVWTH